MEFQTTPYTPMDRAYFEESPEPIQLERPIVPISELGQTVPEKDPRTGAHIIQTTQAAIRAGASQIQWVQTTPSTAAIGGRVKAIGKEAREAIREMIKANDVMVSGWEMPTSSITNMSGFDPQSGSLNEQKRFEDMNEVRDAIRFVGEVAGGGGVDIWSQEFPRTIFDAKFNGGREGVKGWTFKAYDREHEMAVKHLVDDRSGKIIQEIRMNQEINYPEWNRYNPENKFLWQKYGGKPYQDENGKLIRSGDYIDYEHNKVGRENRVASFDQNTHTVIIKKRIWKDFEDEAIEINQEKAAQLGIPVSQLSEEQRVTPQEAFLYASTASQEAIARAYGTQYQFNLNEEIKLLEKLKGAKKYYEQIEAFVHGDKEELIKLKQRDLISQGLDRWITPDYKLPTELIEEEIRQMRDRVRYGRDMATGQIQQAEDLKNQRAHILTADKYAKRKAIESYAELGLHAMHETRDLRTERPIHVGPEIGWPAQWGGHPDEFVELIQTSRKKMVEIMTSSTINGKPNPYFDSHVSKQEAEERAKTHIRGVWDSSHQGMWLNYFRRKSGESEEERLSEFKKWYLEQVQKIIDADVVGAIQAVDSATGAHGHLPAGQGIFPVVDAVKMFRESGWRGAVVSEGHEEEQFGQSRILLETWKAFGAGIHSPGYHSVVPGRVPTTAWGDIQHGYFGRMEPPYFVFGAYSPSNDWTLWSNVQLE
ncbi:hypothetical protein J4457_02905 [Candidatus Woesearchaeota archaeon]|nr:hypothetical protein [Candidatus Woesearchaeota archaeon]